jgi:hypothetical protein
VILLFIVGYFVFWSAIIDRLLEFVPQLVNRRKARLAISGVAVATLFAGDLSFARLVVLPLAISTLVTKYNAGEVRGPRLAVGEECDDFTILVLYPARICSVLSETRSVTYVFLVKTLLLRPILDSIPDWKSVPAAGIVSNESGDTCLTVGDARDCNIV